MLPWRTVKLYFSDKRTYSANIKLIKNDEIQLIGKKGIKVERKTTDQIINVLKQYCGNIMVK